MIKARVWNGKDLKGDWEVTLKIDGVRALYDKDTRSWWSRADKPLFNIPAPFIRDPLDCEVYLGNFRDTIRAVRTQTLKDDTPRISREHLFGLDPLDGRLLVQATVNPSAEAIRTMLEGVVRRGLEGLVLRQKEWVGPDGPHREVWLKVKPEETHDVLITGAIEGVGKHKGRLGALMTAKGKVGTGFSDAERVELWRLYQGVRHRGESIVGQTIEVSCMQFTPDGMFRHPRFVRMRPDKIAEE